MTTMPSARVWIDRIRAIRIWSLVVGFTVGLSATRISGSEWREAFLYGGAGAIVCFFVGWATAVLICAELYRSEIKRAREMHMEQEHARVDALKSMYAEQHGVSPDLGAPPAAAPSGMPQAPMAPVVPLTPQTPPPATGQQAA